MTEQLKALALLIRERNAIAGRITKITDRPAGLGHLGEFIAAEVFAIDLESSASNRGYDGRFRAGPLQGRTVNIKYHYLVLTGPAAPAASSRGKNQPWSIDAVFLFDAVPLVSTLSARGRKVGIATSVVRHLWHDAELYPKTKSTLMVVSEAQREALMAFGSAQLSV